MLQELRRDPALKQGEWEQRQEALQESRSGAAGEQREKAGTEPASTCMTMHACKQMHLLEEGAWYGSAVWSF